MTSCDLLKKRGGAPIDLDSTPSVMTQQDKAMPPPHSVVEKSDRQPGGILLTIKEGPKPAPSSPDYTSDPYCAEHAKPHATYTQAPGAVVHVMDKARQNPDPYPKKAMLGLRNCAFRKPVSLVRAGATLKLMNHDDTMHIIEAMDENQTQLFRIAQPPGAAPIEKQLPEHVRRVHLRCHTHTWEQAWVLTVNNTGYTQQLGAKDSMRFENLPPGPYNIQVWKQGFKEAYSQTDVRSSELTKLTINIQP